MENTVETIRALGPEELESVRGGASESVLDMQTLRVKLEPGDSGVNELLRVRWEGITFMGMKIPVSDPDSLLMRAGMQLDIHLRAKRSCTVRFRMLGISMAVITGVEI